MHKNWLEFLRQEAVGCKWEPFHPGRGSGWLPVPIELRACFPGRIASKVDLCEALRAFVIADLTNTLMSMQLSGKFPPFLLMGAGLMAWEFSAVMAAFAPDFRQDCMHHGAPDFAMEKRP